MKELLKTLCALNGVSGDEDQDVYKRQPPRTGPGWR